ncbi:13130_t:CDS:2, partial [Ambispora leptoticha]
LIKSIDAAHTHIPVKQKLHISRQQLYNIKSQLNLNNPTDLLFWAVILSAFYSLAQLGELLPNNKSDAHKVLTTKVLKFDKVGNSTFATIQLAKTKNHKTANRVTKQWFIAKLKQMIPHEDVAGHSFQAGGTTELVMRGVQLVLIQKIGRWNSESFYRYIRSHQPQSQPS